MLNSCHLSAPLVDFTTEGQEDFRTVELEEEDWRTPGHEDKRTRGQEDKRTGGLENSGPQGFSKLVKPAARRHLARQLGGSDTDMLQLAVSQLQL